MGSANYQLAFLFEQLFFFGCIEKIYINYFWYISYWFICCLFCCIAVHLKLFYHQRSVVLNHAEWRVVQNKAGLTSNRSFAASNPFTIYHRFSPEQLDSRWACCGQFTDCTLDDSGHWSQQNWSSLFLVAIWDQQHVEFAQAAFSFSYWKGH